MKIKQILRILAQMHLEDAAVSFHGSTNLALALASLAPKGTIVASTRGGIFCKIDGVCHSTAPAPDIVYAATVNDQVSFALYGDAPFKAGTPKSGLKGFIDALTGATFGSPSPQIVAYLRAHAGEFAEILSIVDEGIAACRAVMGGQPLPMDWPIHLEQVRFDAVVKHLLGQACRSTIEGKPAYFGESGQLDPLGFFMADDCTLEGLHFSHPRIKAALRNFDSTFLHVLGAMQRVHDCYEPAEWSAHFARIAAENDLTYNG